MSRFLFVVPPLTGHVNPTIALANVLISRGHEVAWCGVPGGVDPLLPDGARFHPACDSDTSRRLADTTARPDDLRGAAALKFLWHSVLLPLADAMVDGVDRAVAEFAPDVLVTDQQALAGGLVAIRRGLRWATSATTSGELVDPLAALPLVADEVRTALTKLQIDHGVPVTDAERIDLRWSPELVLAYTTSALVGPGPFPDQVRFVGPSISDTPTRDGFDWDRLTPDRPGVLVSLGTLNAQAGARFWAAAAEAAIDAPWQGIFVAPPELVPGAPPNVIVVPRVPQVALLAEMSAVVSHGGHNTVCEALAAGLPLVVAPIRDDQPIIAQQVVDAEAGIRIRFARCKAADLGTAIDAVLTDPTYRAAARQVADSFRAAGGASAAADHLEELT